jgi:5-(carboxyamino)imidazole ribonucleotide synthase
MSDSLPKIGLLGGGQLGRMLLQAAIDLDFEISCLDPDAEAPCHLLARHFVQGSFQDFDAVYAFGQLHDVISIEIEHVNIAALERLENEGKLVYPQPHILKMIQDKCLQKQFFKKHGFPTADFILIDSVKDIYDHISFLLAFHKLGKGGYDGRGVQLISSETDIPLGFSQSGLLEKAVHFSKELAVIVARNVQGEISTYPAVEMVFHPVHNLVEFLVSPADIPIEIEIMASKLAVDLIDQLGMVGVLAVEMFLTAEGEILINEIAPRPHNSGHHTIRANETSQYEQHLRAISGLSLGETTSTGFSGMLNLLGEDGYTGPVKYEGLREILSIPGVHPFLYGKKITKPFRKMGHVTILGDSRVEIEEKAEKVRNLIRVIS